VRRLGGLCAPMLNPTGPDGLAFCSMRCTPTFGNRKDCSGGRKLQRLTFRYKHGFRQECIRIRSDACRLRLRMAGPLMNLESRNKWMLLRLTPLTRWRVSLALLSATAWPAPSFSQGTLEQRLACTPDVLRLCSAFIPNADEITTCLGEKNAELSDTCRTAFEAGMKQPPNAGDSTQSRRRTTE
jgi:hypothetical protein